MAWPTNHSLEGNPLAGALGYFSATQQRIFFLALGLVAYLALVRWLRFQRCRNLHKKYPYATRESMSKMTDEDAWAIQKLILQMEFPFIVLKSLQFALFRVCASVHSETPTTNNRTDIRHSDNIIAPFKNLAVLRPSHLLQAICRYRHPDRRVHGL